MSNEIWTHWKPIEGLSTRYYVESIEFSDEDFKVILSEEDNQNKTVTILFENSVFTYRHTDETFRSNLIFILYETHGEDFLSKGRFFKVLNSEYLNWLSCQSVTNSNTLDLTHFSIITLDAVVDIIAGYEPKVILSNP